MPGPPIGLIPVACSTPSALAETVLARRYEPNWQFVTTADDAGEPVVRFLDPEKPKLGRGAGRQSRLYRNPAPLAGGGGS